MYTKRAWSILAAGILAAGCVSAGRPEPKNGGAEPPPETTDDSSATPATEDSKAAPAPEPGADDAAPQSSGYGFHAADKPSSAPAPASAAPSSARDGEGRARSESSAGRASASNAPAKKSRPLDFEPERPGLGTTWGETRESHVSNAAFERSSNNPFSLTSIHYNDSAGVVAMLHSASPVAFRTDAATLVSNGAITVRLVDANGSPLPTFASAKGPLVQGEVGERYMIELVNQTSSRFEAVVSVDGLDVIDGRAGNTEKRGYLLMPFATLDIDGFRQNMEQVAAFRFGSVRGSYAGQKGNDRNVGVIGVALFAERGASPWSEREIERRETADPFPGRFATPPGAR
jgi:hypothetical protein